MSRILIVDDEPSICWGLARLARALGCRVETASSAEHGLALAAATSPDLLMLDVRLPGMDGLTAVSAFRQHMGHAPIVVMTAFGDLGTAVSAVDRGAFEYVVKPFDLAEIRTVIQRALRKMPAELPDSDRTDGAQIGDMLGCTPVMHGVFKRIALAANSSAPVLLRGESGVGKETAARAIHRHSAGKDLPFVAVNLGTLGLEEAEAELARAMASVLSEPPEGATCGTIFFDDVDTAPPAIQAKIARMSENGRVHAAGTPLERRPPVRILAATRRDLAALVSSGEFRDDLFVQLGAFDIRLPPLRERAADIPLLARYFARQISGEVAALADETIVELQRRPWHGNVRELRSVIEHAIVIARTGVLLPIHLPAPLPPLMRGSREDGSMGGASLGEAVASLAKTLLESSGDRGDVYERFLEEVEPPLFATALTRNGNRCAPAARELGLHRTTLKRKLDQYGLDDAVGDR